jgi:hypothetical protein
MCLKEVFLNTSYSSFWARQFYHYCSKKGFTDSHTAGKLQKNIT